MRSEDAEERGNEEKVRYYQSQLDQVEEHESKQRRKPTNKNVAKIIDINTKNRLATLADVDKAAAVRSVFSRQFSSLCCVAVRPCRFSVNKRCVQRKVRQGSARQILSQEGQQCLR